jgi:hypothetical protein
LYPEADSQLRNILGESLNWNDNTRPDLLREYTLGVRGAGAMLKEISNYLMANPVKKPFENPGSTILNLTPPCMME